MGRKLKYNLIGRTFGQLVVIERLANTNGQPTWLSVCACGNLTTSLTQSLITGGKKTCKKTCGYRIGHNLTNSNPREFQRWINARQRCQNPENKSYIHYGGRGIRMCQGWIDNPVAFVNDIGRCPASLSLDRKDNDGHYSCGKCGECKQNGWQFNCRWATRSEQNRNRRKALDKL